MHRLFFIPFRYVERPDELVSECQRLSKSKLGNWPELVQYFTSLKALEYDQEPGYASFEAIFSGQKPTSARGRARVDKPEAPSTSKRLKRQSSGSNDESDEAETPPPKKTSRMHNGSRSTAAAAGTSRNGGSAASSSSSVAARSSKGTRATRAKARSSRSSTESEDDQPQAKSNMRGAAKLAVKRLAAKADRDDASTDKSKSDTWQPDGEESGEEAETVNSDSDSEIEEIKATKPSRRLPARAAAHRTRVLGSSDEDSAGVNTMKNGYECNTF